MKDLEGIRSEIDTIDNELIELLEKRNALVESVIKYKINNNKDIYDEKRESRILKGIGDKVKEKGNITYIQAVFMSIMNESKKKQSEILANYKENESLGRD